MGSEVVPSETMHAIFEEALRDQTSASMSRAIRKALDPYPFVRNIFEIGVLCGIRQVNADKFRDDWVCKRCGDCPACVRRRSRSLRFSLEAAMMRPSM